MRYLFSKTDALGDQLLATGTISALLQRQPSAHVIWLVRNGYESVHSLLADSRVFRPDITRAPVEEASRLRNSPAPSIDPPLWGRATFIPLSLNAYAPHPPDRDLLVDAAWWIDFTLALNVDCAIAGTINLNWVDQTLTFASAAPRRIGYEVCHDAQPIPPEIDQLLRTRQLSTSFTDTLAFPRHSHEGDNLARLIEPVTGEPGLPEIRLDPMLDGPVKASTQHPTIALAPGAGDVERIYPLSQLASAVCNLADDGVLAGHNLLILQGPKDAEICRQLTLALRENNIISELRELGDLRELYQLLTETRLLICNESFWAHIAAASGTPTVAIWGLGHWGRFLPRQGNVTVLHTEMLCQRCNWLCCFPTRRCIHDISVQSVVNAAKERLMRGRANHDVQFQSVESIVPDAVVRDSLYLQAKIGQDSANECRVLKEWLNQEIAAKEKALKLFRQAETQRDHLKTAHQAEADAKLHWEQLYHAAEAQRDDLRSAHQAETDDKLRWERLFREAESQRDNLTVAITEERVAAAKYRDDAEAAIAGEARSRQRVEEDLAVYKGRQEELLKQVHQMAAQIAFQETLVAESNRLKRKQTAFTSQLGRVATATARGLRRAYNVIRGDLPAAELPHKIAQINTHDIIGGAERTSYDLHQVFRSRALRPTLIVGGKFGDDADVFKIQFQASDWQWALKWRDEEGFTEVIHQTPLSGCFTWDHLRKADIVHVHNMHGKYWNLLTLVPLGWQHPIVLTLHDEYTLTGDCCYTYDCERWQKSCGKCPQISLDASARYALGAKDRTRINVWIKRILFHLPKPYPFVIVTPSEWLAQRARRSPNLHHLPIVCVPYGIDLTFWRPLPQHESRDALGIPPGKTIGLVVASALHDRRKGFDIALEAIQRTGHDQRLHFVLVGNVTDEIREKVRGLPVTVMGYVTDKNKMVRLFSAADFTLAMSRVDNLPYMCLESLACGRPIIGSKIGGIPEIVNEPALGALIPAPFATADIASAILEFASQTDEAKGARFGICRRSAEVRFSLSRMADTYLKLYTEMLAAWRQHRPVDLTVIGY